MPRPVTLQKTSLLHVMHRRAHVFNTEDVIETCPNVPNPASLPAAVMDCGPNGKNVGGSVQDVVRTGHHADAKRRSLNLSWTAAARWKHVDVRVIP